ncbi:hypothetical protein FOL47_010271 [Perkinsus chesapeaki]|uniref:protein disulfide-isomerase n=1 Tax=Perkinsus chesapeaki TaxID=330153 RepID=A0A7J6L317_PERCH|nr:hypothetical protein FOL47_010271 [Perkinsus chesapeaki]
MEPTALDGISTNTPHTSGGDATHIVQPSYPVRVWRNLSRMYTYYLEKTTIWTKSRWVAFFIACAIYGIRVYFLQGFYIVTYGWSIYLLNLFIGFISPQIDEDSNAPVLPTRDSDEFRPFQRRLPEFVFWKRAMQATIIAIIMTFFPFFDLPVFWPILLVYFIMLFTLTMKEQIKHMIKHRYVPWSHGKKSILIDLTAAAALYGKKDSFVQVLDSKTFSKTVIQSNELWVVEFYADWCGHCQQFAPEYEKAAKAMAGIVNFAAVNDQAVMGPYGVQGFPTVKFFGDDKSKALDYNGPRTADGLVKYSISQVKKAAKDRLAGKSKPKKAKKDQSGGGKSKGKADTPPEGNDEDVIVLTGNNFEKLVMQDEKSVWFIEFYAPWCGHCKALAPHWTAAATQMKGKVKFGKVDATEEQSLAQRFNVQGFPTVKLFPAGKKSDTLAVDYQDARDTSSIVQFAEKYYTFAKEATQLLNQEDFEENCKNNVCVIAFLPHILDSGAEERNAYIKEYNDAVRANPGIPVHYYWSQGGDQFDFEEALRLQFGYPALVAVHLSKGHYGVHRGGFDEANIRSFVSGLMAGKVTLDPIPKNLPKLRTVTAWDGKDAKPAPEEDSEL